MLNTSSSVLVPTFFIVFGKSVSAFTNSSLEVGFVSNIMQQATTMKKSTSVDAIIVELIAIVKIKVTTRATNTITKYVDITSKTT